MGHRTHPRQPVPLLGPAQPLGSPLCCSRPTVLPFLQRHSVPVPYRRHLGLYSCYQGNRGTQSPQLPGSRDPSLQVPPPFLTDKNPWRECGLGAPHPPAALRTVCLSFRPDTPVPNMLASPSSPQPLKRDSRPWKKLSVQSTQRSASGLRVGRGRLGWGPRCPLKPASNRLEVSRPTLHQKKALPALGQPSGPCDPLPQAPQTAWRLKSSNGGCRGPGLEPQEQSTSSPSTESSAGPGWGGAAEKRVLCWPDGPLSKRSGEEGSGHVQGPSQTGGLLHRPTKPSSKPLSYRQGKAEGSGDGHQRPPDGAGLCTTGWLSRDLCPVRF